MYRYTLCWAPYCTAMGDEKDPMVIGGVNGARGIVQYSCWGGQKLEVKLEVGVLKMEYVINPST
jgi:hypothetical protein